MNMFLWELDKGASLAVIAPELGQARSAALGQLELADQNTSDYHKKAECRKFRTLVESGSIPQSIPIGVPPYVTVVFSSNPAERNSRHDISIGSMINSQIAIASPGAIYTQKNTASPAEDLQHLIATLHASLDKMSLTRKDRDELQSQAETVSAQLRREAPSRPIVGECLRSIQTILEGVASDVIAAPILAKLALL